MLILLKQKIPFVLCTSHPFFQTRETSFDKALETPFHHRNNLDIDRVEGKKSIYSMTQVIS